MPDATPPKVLYKYCPPERLDIFENWSIRFTSPSHFNDRFETSWPQNASLSKKDRLQFERSLAILCLTQDPDNHLMWVHYAAQHRGFVIGFRTGDALFSDDGAHLGKVKYRACPQGIAPPSKQVCLYKDKVWAYEKEWRCIRLIKSSESRDVFLPPQAVAEVIMGSEMTTDNRTLVLRNLHYVESIDPDADVAINTSKLNREFRTIKHEQYDSKVCPHCGGSGQIKQGSEYETLPVDSSADEEQTGWARLSMNDA